MTVNTSAIVFGHVTTWQIADVLLEWGATAIKMRSSTYDENFDILAFQEPDGRGRSMSIFLKSSVNSDYADTYKGPSTFLDIGANGRDEDIMRAVLERFGGYIRIAGGDWQPVAAVNTTQASDDARFDDALASATEAARRALDDRGFKLASVDELRVAIASCVQREKRCDGIAR